MITLKNITIVKHCKNENPTPNQLKIHFKTNGINTRSRDAKVIKHINAISEIPKFFIFIYIYSFQGGAYRNKPITAPDIILTKVAIIKALKPNLTTVLTLLGAIEE